VLLVALPPRESEAHTVCSRDEDGQNEGGDVVTEIYNREPHWQAVVGEKHHQAKKVRQHDEARCHGNRFGLQSVGTERNDPQNRSRPDAYANGDAVGHWQRRKRRCGVPVPTRHRNACRKREGQLQGQHQRGCGQLDHPGEAKRQCFHPWQQNARQSS
jgi:hypothetical protein